MKNYAVIIISLLILIFIFINSKVKISINLNKSGKNDEVIFKVSGLLGIIKYEKKYPFFDLSANKEGVNLKFEQKTSRKGNLITKFNERLKNEELLITLHNQKEAFKYILKKAKIEDLKSHMYFSNENVFTSIFLFNFVNIIYKYIYDNINTKNMSLKIIPGFNENKLKIHFKIIFNLRIINFLYLIKYYKSFQINKGGAYNE
ncbi:hypothetical protein [Tepidibacter formicigenes]|jgi:hypothetical protein|uniref:DUF2953 domain-containing protein n=1 Tax=Tepidibacter formicigenes DSM 15518 TaxID=1123349 RepID=A0A1M6LNZ7_9FIRM|nr:hypothetical protein [Tepidibacter formicigenes]SHJ72792.1 hypothetical protein SAMN02744037_00706 [Tepidibacter formicigenes DSM 15518]